MNFGNDQNDSGQLGLQFLDKTTMGYSSVFGIIPDNHLVVSMTMPGFKGGMLSWIIGSRLFLGYVSALSSTQLFKLKLPDPYSTTVIFSRSIQVYY
jgi:hypothetical protein